MMHTSTSDEVNKGLVLNSLLLSQGGPVLLLICGIWVKALLRLTIVVRFVWTVVVTPTAMMIVAVMIATITIIVVIVIGSRLTGLFDITRKTTTTKTVRSQPLHKK